MKNPQNLIINKELSMNLSNIALCGVVFVAALYGLAIFLGLLAAWPWGLIGLVFIGIIGYLFFNVLAQRLSNKEDDYYEKNVKD